MRDKNKEDYISFSIYADEDLPTSIWDIDGVGYDQWGDEYYVIFDKDVVKETILRLVKENDKLCEKVAEAEQKVEAMKKRLFPLNQELARALGELNKLKKEKNEK